jgi:hypothetical protein
MRRTGRKRRAIAPTSLGPPDTGRRASARRAFRPENPHALDRGSLVPSTWGRPTVTIQPLALRAAERIARLSRGQQA